MKTGKIVYLFLFDTLSDWEIGYVTAGILVLCALAQIVLFLFPGGILETASSFFATGVYVVLP